MSEVSMSTYMRVTLTIQEFSLVGRALSGQLRGKDVRAAAELNVQLAVQAAQHATERAEVHQGVVMRAQEALALAPEELSQ